MARVTIKNLKKSYGKTDVLRGINIDIPDGAFVALVGPSGCGKSTLLRMVAGLEEVVIGEISIGDQVINEVLPKHRNVAMVFQNYALYPHLTVRENMGFSLKLRGLDKVAMAREVQKAAEILNLEALLDRLPRQLSGGQRQRVAMGRAIVRNPEVFLFDEPLSNLDAKLRVQMRSEIKSLQQRLAITTIYVTHDQMEAMTMADVVVVMHDGEVEQIAAPMDLYDSPANTFVASFIGSPNMNMIEGILKRDSSGLMFVSESVQLPLDSSLDGEDGMRVICGIRPEHLDLSELSDVRNVITGILAQVEPTGPETHVTLELANNQKLIAVFPERHDFVRNKPLSVNPRQEKIHLFDAATGKSMGTTIPTGKNQLLPPAGQPRTALATTD